ncbi:hypothetical protein J26TS2_36240 [Shouchella clausii]|uniref:hypothetical protein n=1 Tax=Shouchella tritolerans TaxID=2979466 RepID=UPI00078973D9|nr:hypothetical protein [Shouchella tritolerans]GIN13757.1 hypothetical protein J26TS2_36240 [Shouchella clausii]
MVEIDLLYALTVYETYLVEPLEETGLYQHLGNTQTEQTVSFQNIETSFVIDLNESTSKFT